MSSTSVGENLNPGNKADTAMDISASFDIFFDFFLLLLKNTNRRFAFFCFNMESIGVY